ncbi:hypothetical protein G4X40_22580 [Rhodococcus sp. D2-41]|nr:hypothetical protein [Rhodococcus sp. D2-41]MDG3012927.1 hypothetical protein [Rhodococcus sp. D2-41]
MLEVRGDRPEQEAQREMRRTGYRTFCGLCTVLDVILSTLLRPATVVVAAVAYGVWWLLPH